MSVNCHWYSRVGSDADQRVNVCGHGAGQPGQDDHSGRRASLPNGRHTRTGRQDSYGSRRYGYNI